MRLTTIGAVCATCAAAVPASLAVAAEPSTPAIARVGPIADIAPDAVGTDMRTAGRKIVIDRHLNVERKHARLGGEHLTRGERGALRDALRGLTPREVRHETRAARHDMRRLRARLERKRESAGAGSGTGAAVPGALQSIAACESGGDPGAVDPSGTYRGKYQFDRGTWASVGGSGDPAAAPEAEQDRRAAALYAQAGAGRWPVCGR